MTTQNPMQELVDIAAGWIAYQDITRATQGGSPGCRQVSRGRVRLVAQFCAGGSDRPGGPVVVAGRSVAPVPALDAVL